METAALEIDRVTPETPEGMRSAVRFPLALPVHLMIAAKQYKAVTENISANGVLLHVDGKPLHLSKVLAPGTVVEFLIEIPEGMIAPLETAAVHCTGRVVRSYSEPSMMHAAAVIDEYSFQ
jgi:hypothetical protein